MDIKKNEGQEAVINTTEGQLIVIACPEAVKQQHLYAEFITWSLIAISRQNQY